METLLGYSKRIEEGYNTLVSGLINQAIALNVWNSVKTALRTPGFCESMTDEQWERLNKLAAQNYLVDLKTVIDGEFVFLYDTIQHFVFNGGAQNGRFLRASLSEDFGSWLDDPENFMSGFIPYDFLLVDENIYRERLYQYRQRLEDAIFENDRVLRNQKFKEMSTFTIIDNYFLVPKGLTIRSRSCATARNIFCPADIYQTCLLSRDRNFATQKMVQVAIAIERYRVKEGQYPESLEQLVGKYWDEKQQGAIRFDPCSGKNTLGYRINQQSKEDWERELKQGREKDPEYRHEFDDYSFPVWRPYILYSVGSDLKDDNGEILSLTSDEGDLIF